MGKYALKNKLGEAISIIFANSIEEAIKLFCFRKKFNKHVLLNLFDVVKVES